MWIGGSFYCKFSKPEILDNKFYWNVEKPKTHAYRLKKIDKTPENSIDESESHNIYASMAHMSPNTEIPRRNYGNSSQLTNWVLDSGATCHMAPDISYFVLVSLVETEKYIEVVDGHSKSK